MMAEPNGYTTGSTERTNHPMSTKRPPVKWVDYTAAMADDILAKNSANRKLRQPVVDRYRRDMMDGNWRINGDSIKIADDGTLIDGQHRLEAISQAGDRLKNPITILTVTGLPMAEVMPITDTGLKRMPSDAVHLAGYRNAVSLSAMARGVIRLQTGRIFKSGGVRFNVTNSEMMEWLKANPGAEDLVSENLWVLRKSNLPPGAGLTAFWFIYDLDAFRAVEFIQRLATLEGLKQGSPIAALARAINTARINRTLIREHQWLTMVFTAWNGWLADEKWSKPLTVGHGLSRDSFPFPMSPDEALAAAEAKAVAAESQEVLPVA